MISSSGNQAADSGWFPWGGNIQIKATAVTLTLLSWLFCSSQSRKSFNLINSLQNIKQKNYEEQSIFPQESSCTDPSGKKQLIVFIYIKHWLYTAGKSARLEIKSHFSGHCCLKYITDNYIFYWGGLLHVSLNIPLSTIQMTKDI